MWSGPDIMWSGRAVYYPRVPGYPGTRLQLYGLDQLVSGPDHIIIYLKKSSFFHVGCGAQ